MSLVYPYKIYDTANRFNYAKSSIVKYNQGEADFGTFNNFGGLTTITTDGFGTITVDSTANQASSTFYSINIPNVNNIVVVEVNITVSNASGTLMNWLGDFQATAETYIVGTSSQNLLGNGSFTFIFEANIITSQSLRLGFFYDNISVNTQVQFNSVKIYEKGKKVIDTPSNGILYNKTVQNLGVVYPSLTTDYKNFYNNNVNREYGLNIKNISNFNGALGFGNIIGTGDLSLVLHFIKSDSSGIWRTFLLNSGDIPAFAYLQLTNDTILNLLTSNISNNRLITLSEVGYDNVIDVNKRLEITVVIKFTGGSTRTTSIYDHEQKKWYDFIDNISYDFTGKVSFSLFQENTSNHIILRQSIINRTITKEEALNLDLVNNANKIEDYIYNEINGLDVYSKGIPIRIPLSVNFNDKVGGGWVEKKSTLPPIRQGLTGTIQRGLTISNFDPVRPTGVGRTYAVYMNFKDIPINTVYAWSWIENTQNIGLPSINYIGQISGMSNQSLFDTLSNSGYTNVIVFYKEELINNNTQTKQSVYIGGYKVAESINNGDVIFDLASSPNKLGVGGINGSFGINVSISLPVQAFYAFWNRDLTDTEILEVSQSFNPNTKSTFSRSLPQDDLLLLFQFQEGSFYNDGVLTNPRHRNLAPTSNFPIGSASVPSDWDLERLGLSAGTVDEKLGELRSKIIDLNTLK